jgi:hypothetical protein
MKRIIILSIALSLFIGLLALMSSDSTVKAETLYRADTGMVTLGPNQFLRLTVANTATQRSRVTSLTVTFSTQVTFASCNSEGVCTHTVTTQTTTAPVTLSTGQAASFDIIPPAGASAVRGIVMGNSPNAQVNELIIDGSTGTTAGAAAGILYAALHNND